MNKKGLWIVMDQSGRQWLCPYKPSKIGTGYKAEFFWGKRGPGGVEFAISNGNGCIQLPEGEGLDESCFEDKGRWQIFPVEIKLA